MCWAVSASRSSGPTCSSVSDAPVSSVPAGAGRPAKRLLVLDSSYSLEAIRQKRLEPSVLCRDLDGYFDEVFTVHPFATLVTSDAWAPKYGVPIATRLSPRHVFIEGKMGLS